MAEHAGNAWQIAFDGFEPADERRREALFALGNGLLSWRASSPEAAGQAFADSTHEVHYAGLYRAGWYDEAPRRVNGRDVSMAAVVNLPDPFGLTFAEQADGDGFSLQAVILRGYRQSLDLEGGRLERDIRFLLGEHEVRLREVRFVSMDAPHLAVLRWELELPPAVRQLHIRSVLDGSVSNAAIKRNQAYEGRRLKQVEQQHTATGVAVMSARLDSASRRVAIASQTLIEGASPVWAGRWADDRLVQEACCPLPANGRLCLEKHVVVQVDAELPADDRSAREQVIRQLPRDGFARLLARHEQAWHRLWARMPLHCDDPQLERVLRFHAFHLLQTVSPHKTDGDLGFPPRGWQEGYFSQVFWDEIFAFPFFVTHFPQLACGLLRYRHRRLGTARQRAQRAGLRGAMFPWRSAHSGEEETPPYQCNPLSGRWMPDHTRLQRHIGSAVAYDAWLLYLASGDEALLMGEAGELILEVARFWASLARYDAARERYLICAVIGPDEYHNSYPDADRPGLDNNAYTNLMAVWTLCRGLELLTLLPADKARELRLRLGLQDDELCRWDEISRRMFLPLRDDGVLGQFEGFDRLKPPPQQWLHDNHPRLDWMLEAQHDSSDRYQLSKQGDVLMLFYLFSPQTLLGLFQRLGYALDEAALRRTLAWHLAHITHESSLSQVVCAGALARFDSKASWDYFLQSLRVDLQAPSDGGTREGVHLGAMAGSLDVLQRHYLGLQPSLDGLHVFPAPPAGLGNLQLQLRYRGASLDVALRGDRLHIASSADNHRDTPIVHAGGHYQLAPGQQIELDCTPRH